MKKLLRFAGVALLALTVGCDDDEVVTPVAPVAPPTPAPIFGTVSGTVSVEGSGLVGVSVSLSGAASQSASTGSSGGYSFTNVPAGTHSVQISGAPADVAFGSTATAVTITTSGQTATADFPGTYIRSSRITGSVTAGGEGVVATVTATGSGMLTDEEPAIGSSDTDGNFELTGLRAGTYHVAISELPEGIEFLVTMRNVTVSVGLSANVSFNAPGEDRPTTGTDPFLIITGITDADPDDDKISGRVTATIDVERGDFEKIALYVDGAEVDAQLFGFGPASAEEPPVAAQQGVLFSLSFDSDEYDPDTGEVTYPNGAHEIVAGVTVQGSTEEAYSNRMEVEFKNSDRVVASVSGLGDGAMNSSTGQLWYGGRDASVEISALAVSYSSGAAVSAVTLLSFCGDDAATDSEAPFVFEVDCDGYTTDTDMYEDGEKPAFTVGGDEVDVSASAVYLDFEGPMAPHFHPNPNEREGGWVNLTVDFLGEQKSSNKDGLLVYNDEDEAGVGGYLPQLRVSTAAPSVVGGALEAGVVEGVPALPPAGTKANAVCAVVTAVDLLGNESKLPKAADPCVTYDHYVEDDDGDYPAGLRAGLDTQPPTIKFSPASPKANGSSLKNFQVEVADVGGSTGKSGLHSMPVLSKVEARDADNDVLCGDDDDGVGGGGEESLSGECKLAGGVDFNDPLATTSGLGSGSETGYYTFTAMAQDKAGNKSEQIMRTTVNDTDDPELGLIVGGYSKGDWSLTATLTDNLSLKAYWPEAFDIITGVGPATGILILPREGGVAVDEYNSAEFTQSHLTTPPITMQTYRAMQAAGPGTPGADVNDAVATIDSIQVVSVDHGGGSGRAANTALGATTGADQFGYNGTSARDAVQQTSGETADQAEQWNENKDNSTDANDIRFARDEVFQDFVVEDDESDEDALELRATIRGTAGYMKAVAAVADDSDTEDVDEEVEEVQGMEGLVNNPISRVDFYAAVLLDEVSGSSAGTNNKVPPVPDGPAEAAGGNEALVLLGSASAAGAEDYKCADADRTPSDADNAVDCREYVWALDISGADVVEMAGGEGEYTIVAIAVNDDGVAIFTSATTEVED